MMKHIMRFLNRLRITRKIKYRLNIKLWQHNDFKEKYADNKDNQNREIAFNKIFDEVMGKQRKNELDLYRLILRMKDLKLECKIRLKEC